MSIRLFMDEHVDFAVTIGLRQAGYDVLTAQEDGSDGLPDERLLMRATSLGRVLVTHDQDFLVVGANHQQRGIEFSGIIYGRQQRLSVGELIDVLKTIVYCCEPDELRNQVCFVSSP